MLDLDIMYSLNRLITKELELNNFVFSESVVDSIVNILLANDDKSNLMFYNFFQNVELYNKNQVIERCIYNILARLNILISNCNKNKLLNVHWIIPSLY